MRMMRCGSVVREEVEIGVQVLLLKVVVQIRQCKLGHVALRARHRPAVPLLCVCVCVCGLVSPTRMTRHTHDTHDTTCKEELGEGPT